MDNPTNVSNGAGRRPRHLYDTGLFATLPPEEAARRRPKVVRLTGPAPAGRAAGPAADSNSTHIWPATNAGQAPVPTPRPAAPPASPPASEPAAVHTRDWRTRLAATAKNMPWPARLLAIFLVACVVVIAAATLGVGT